MPKLPLSLILLASASLARAEEPAATPPAPTHVESKLPPPGTLPLPAPAPVEGAPEDDIFVMESMRGEKLVAQPVDFSSFKLMLQKTPSHAPCKLSGVRVKKKPSMLEFTIPGNRRRLFQAVQVFAPASKWDLGAGVALYQFQALDKSEVWVKVDQTADGKPQISRVYVKPEGKPGHDCE